MKKILYFLLSAAAVLSVSSCKDFLDRGSLTTMDDSTYWTSENNVRMFVNDCYGSYFTGYSDSWGQVYAPGVYSSGEFSDDRTSTGTQFNILLALPADNWYRATLNYRGYWLARRASGPWNFAYIRKWNLLLERLETMKENKILTDEQYNHWTGVARFLRGWEYSRFVESFGDVPLYTATIATDDMEAQYKGRDPRTTVMNQVYEDFDYAYKNVRSDDGKDYINKAVVATIGGRCLLFEGSWYIFHKNDEALKTCTDIDGCAKKYLTLASSMTQDIIDSGKYGFDTAFRTLFGTLYTTLNGVANEVILYRTYNKTVISGAQHCIASYSNGDESQVMSGNLSTLEAYVCTDGKIYSQSTVEGAKSWDMGDVVKSRDSRLEATFWDEFRNTATGMYIEKFCPRSGVEYAYNGQARPTWCGSDTNENGFPCVRFAETCLVNIEAKCLLADYCGGTAVSQKDLDATINAIRKRPLDETALLKGCKQTEPLTLEMAKNMNDPKRTSGVITTTLGYKTRGAATPLLWEIWRERRMEFVAEQARALDIRRLGQLELLNYTANIDAATGSYAELDKVASIYEGDSRGWAPQTTSLKKTKSNVGYDLLVDANKGKTCVRPFEGYNADGTIKFGNPIYWGKLPASGAYPNATYTEDRTKMRGFIIPQNFVDRDADNYSIKNYLEPVCSQVISQYADHYESAGGTNPLTQNPGW